MGTPKVVRSPAYCTDMSRHAWMQPTARAAIATRPSSRVARNCAKPRPRWPSRWSAGTLTSVNVSGWVSEMCQPSLSYAGSATNPDVPEGTTIVLTSAVPSSRVPVRAVTVTTEVISDPELVMNCLEPLITHASSTSSARVRVAAASDPAPGSVRPNPASARPATRSGSHVAFCSSLPNVRIGLIPRPTAASSVIPIDWSTRPSSSMATQRLVKSPAAPPYSSGAVSPKRPSFPISWTRSTGKWCAWSHLATCGARASCANSRTVRRKASCSSESSNGMDDMRPIVQHGLVSHGPAVCAHYRGTMTAVIEVSGLVKDFGSFRALDGLDLEVQQGEVHGFLGPNGAGKSTTIRILLGMLRGTSGSVRLLGGDPWRDATTLHKRLAYVPGDVNLWPQLSGGEVIDLLGRLRGGVDERRRDVL